MPYKPKLGKQAYKPKFKGGDLRQIARKISSTDDYKSDIDPVEYEWFPSNGYVKLHMQLAPDADQFSPVTEQDTYSLVYPIRPFQIGHGAWVKEIIHVRDVRIKCKQFVADQKAFFYRAMNAKFFKNMPK